MINESDTIEARSDRPVIDASIEVLNSDCFCISLDTAALRAALESEIGQPGLFDLVQQRCPYLFAARPVFVSHKHMARMAEVIEAIESVVALPAYREEVLAASPAIARHDPRGAEGVFFGYDFHATEDDHGGQCARAEHRRGGNARRRARLDRLL